MKLKVVASRKKSWNQAMAAPRSARPKIFGVLVIGFAVVGFAVVGFAVTGFAVVGLVVGLAVGELLGFVVGYAVGVVVGAVVGFEVAAPGPPRKDGPTSLRVRGLLVMAPPLINSYAPTSFCVTILGRACPLISSSNNGSSSMFAMSRIVG